MLLGKQQRGGDYKVAKRLGQEGWLALLFPDAVTERLEIEDLRLWHQYYLFGISVICFSIYARICKYLMFVNWAGF